jgi:RNA polymerase sigma-70 factor, ECF subfamily
VLNHGTTAMNVLAVDPDARLMLEVRDDNAAAFEELVLRFQDRLVNVLEHIVRNHQWAEDLAQEVFMRVFRARKTYEPGAKFSTWLFTIANNVASNALRNRSRRKEVSVSSTGHSDSSAMPLAEMAPAKSSFMPARRLDKQEISQVVQMAMESLSERQRTALVLNKFESMSYQDIAETMGLTEKAVKSLLSRARVNLRVILEPYSSGTKNGETDMSVEELNPFDPAEEELVAYLDGELEPAARQKLEQRLSSDTVFRDKLRRTQKAWEALDLLPKTHVDHNFANSTMEMTVTLLSQEAPHKAAKTDWNDWLPLLKIAGLALFAFSLGFFMVRKKHQADYQQQLRDLPVVERIDQLEDAQDIEFLRMLQKEKLFGGANHASS